MIVISNASPLLALSQACCLHVLQVLFGKIYIPDTVYNETVEQCNVNLQKRNIEAAIGDFIEVSKPIVTLKFSRNLGLGEQGVLRLAMEKKADILLIDDKKARNEAKELGFVPFFTTDVLRYAEQRRGIVSYAEVVETLRNFHIYLP